MPDDPRTARSSVSARLTYEVALAVNPALADRLERYMRERHIPDVLATGCFLGAAFEREAPGHYRTRYVAASLEELNRYLDEHAAALRADFAAHFPSLTAQRANWEELERWGRA